MNPTLEDKLRAYEKSTPITNDKELLTAIESIIAKEESKPAEERDYDLIDEAIDTMLSLSKVDTEVLDRRAEEISDKCIAEVKANDAFSRKNRNSNLRKLFKLIPVAALVTLFISTSLVANAMGYDFLGDAFEWIKSKLYHPGDISTVGEFAEYTSLDEFATVNEYSYALLPTELPSGFTVTKITAQTSYVEESKDSFEVYRSIDIKMICDDMLQRVSIETITSDESDDSETVRIGEFDVICSGDGTKYKGIFVHENNLYTVTASSYKNMECIICSLGKRQ